MPSRNKPFTNQIMIDRDRFVIDRKIEVGVCVMRTPTNPQTYALALHWAYMTCPDIDVPEPQRSAMIDRKIKAPRSPIRS